MALALLSGHDLVASSSFGDNPFTLGVASGDPTPEGIVLWTRLAPVPVAPATLGRRAIPVGWRVATGSRMRHVVARGTARAEAELAHGRGTDLNAEAAS
jgi:alkaline phosphatase D